MNKLYIVIPSYNEQINIENLVCDWYPVTEQYDGKLVIINDGSKDDTYSVLMKLAVDRPKLEVLTKENGGHGDTLLYGYRYAIDHGAEWIFQTDSDGQTKAAEFAGFWEARNSYDAIFGHRRVRGDGAIRKFVEDVLCIVLWCMFGIRVPDANCPFRLMKAEKVAQYTKKLPVHYSLPNVMLTVFFSKNDKVKFKEISFEKRKSGQNSINMKKIVKIGMQSLRDFRYFRCKME